VVVKALLHAELLKLRSTRTTAGLLLATLGLVALTVGSEVPKAGAAEGPLSLDDPGLLADVVATCFGVPPLLMVLYGTLAFTQEFRYGTITSTYLGEPSRARVLVAKWLALALVSAVITTATLALSVLLSSALIRSRDASGGSSLSGSSCWRRTASSVSPSVPWSATRSPPSSGWSSG
jgi:ABC-2 type transport system permease protein